MQVTLLDIMNNLAKYEVAVAKAQFMFESQTGIKLDKMTDFVMKFIYTESLEDNDVTMTILANTTMSSENSIRSKLKILIKNDLVEISQCGNDGRNKKILPTEFLKHLMLVDAASKLKTAESISKPFKLMFGDSLMNFYKEYNLEEFKAFTKYDAYDFYKSCCKKEQDKQKNTLNKLG
jgi:hypothetical protein